ncbi:TolC family protein [Desulfoferrobacter suflitae]|uniref:TolC family protein n=1 Tax=Desulfoferrobacter suflitae TaxID=2865782 RepID=UPI002164BF46|nr:TolC family protein [Desulfoferrobacter suflitae]MCK8603669.1 TolC family protein [Desulfoferrobacter suflitae]
MKLIMLTLFTLLYTGGCALVHPTNSGVPVEDLRFLQEEIPVPSPKHTQPLELSGEMTLDRCIETALQNNPELAASDWDVAASVARVKQAQASRWPSLGVEANVAQYLDNQRLIPTRYNGEPGDFDDQIVRQDLVLRLPIFTGGRITNEIRAAELLRQAQEGNLTRTRDELIFNVSSTFYAILGQRKVLRSIEFSMQAMEENHKQVAELLAVQKAAKVDLLRTEVRQADLKQSLVREENVLAIQKRVLANLLGLDYRSERLSFEGKLQFEPVDYDADRLLAAALQDRPDYQAAKSRLEAQARRVDIARAGHWPTVSVLGAYGLRADFKGDAEDAGAVGLGMSIPLFEGGRVVAKVNEEKAALAAAQERLRRLELQIRQEVETALLDVRSNRERVKAVEKAIEQAKESLRIERMKYDLGMGAIVDVLDAQSALLQSETSYYRALADFRSAIARLKLATGGKLS